MISDDESTEDTDEVVDETPDASNPEQAKDKRKKLKWDSEIISDFWRRALSDKAGRLALYGLLRDARIFGLPVAVTPNGFPMEQASWAHLGEQQFGWRLYRTLMKVDTVAVNLMMKECDPELQDSPKPKRRKQS